MSRSIIVVSALFTTSAFLRAVDLTHAPSANRSDDFIRAEAGS